MPALGLLFSDYERARDAQNLRRVFEGMVDRNLGGALAKNNFAILSLVLGQKTDRAYALAKELYEATPQDPQAVVLYAFAQQRQGRAAEGARLMHTLPAERLAVPEVAAYYTIVLSAAGEREEARRAAVLGEKANLLPEEMKLFELASASVR